MTPDTRGIGLLEFHQIDRAVEAGRAAGRAALDATGDREGFLARTRGLPVGRVLPV